MSSAKLIKLKIELYAELLRQNYAELNNTETQLAYYLAMDEDIQKVLRKATNQGSHGNP